MSSLHPAPADVKSAPRIGRVRFWLARHLAPMPVPTVTEIDLDIPAPTVHHHRPGRLS